MSEIGKDLLKRLASFGTKNSLGETVFPQGTAGKMTFEICMAIAALDLRLDALEGKSDINPEELANFLRTLGLNED